MVNSCLQFHHEQYHSRYLDPDHIAPLSLLKNQTLGDTCAGSQGHCLLRSMDEFEEPGTHVPRQFMRLHEYKWMTHYMKEQMASHFEVYSYEGGVGEAPAL